MENIKSWEELSGLCLEITDFESLDMEYMNINIEELEIIKKYIENNITKFAIIDEYNTQFSIIAVYFKDLEERKKLSDEMYECKFKTGCKTNLLHKN